MRDSLSQPPPVLAAPYIGRFAPTPSGALHLGSLVAALGSYLDAKAQGGLWRLRLDDLDSSRCAQATGTQIIAQLADHGLLMDGEIIWQSSRLPLYQAALDALKERAAVYRCQCRRTTLRAACDAGEIGEGIAGPIYPGTCRAQPPSITHPAGWRWQVPSTPITLNDRFLGEQTQILPQTVGDPLLARSDGVFAYHLAEVVDNHALGITDVVRGADLAPLSPLHLALHHELFPTAPPPRYAHVPLVLGTDGRKLSKTNQAEPINARNARQNLMQAAHVLGLTTPDPSAPIESMLASWTTQWAQTRLTPAT